MTGSPVKVLGKVDICVRLGLLEFSHQMLVADIVDKVIPVSYTHLIHCYQYYTSTDGY